MTFAIPTSRSPKASTKYNALPADVYPAKAVRFIGLGMQDQPEFQGQKKNPAFKVMIQFELLGVDSTGTTPDGTPIPAGTPACVFSEYYLFPNASRGKVFDLVRAVDPSLQAVPSTIDWFGENLLDKGLFVNVGSYTNKNGEVKNCVNGISPAPTMMVNNFPQRRADLVFFNPYDGSETALASYEKLYKFQRDLLMEAHDASHIPFAGKEVVFNKEGEKPLTTATSSADISDDTPF